MIPWAIHWIALTFLAVAIGGNLFLEYIRIEKRETDQLLLQTKIVQKVLDHDLVAVDAVLKDLARHANEPRGFLGSHHHLDLLANALSGVRTVTFYDAHGTVLASSNPELLGKNFSQREYFKAIVQDHNPDTLYISSPFKSLLGTWVILAGRMVAGPDGAFAGVVNASLDDTFFAPLLASVLYAPDMWATLVHADGTVFLRVPQRENVEGQNIALPTTFFTRHMQSGIEENVFKGLVHTTQEDRLLAIRSIRPSGVRVNVPLVVGVSRDLDAMYAGWRRDVLLQGGGLLAVGLFSTFVLLAFQKWRRQNEAEKARAVEALAERNRFIHMVVDNIPGMVGYWNTEKRCEFANKAYLEWFGKTQDQMLGFPIQELMDEALYAKNEPYILATLRGEAQTFERALTKADGSIGHTLARYIPDKVDGAVRGFFVLVSDVTELKYTQQELERRVRELHALATTDALTGISNRRHFLDRAEEEIVRARRYGVSLVFLMIDIDHFKNVNDTHGHDVGDAVLRSMGAALRETVRATDHVGRLGGEEFGALLIEITAAEARVVAERFRSMLQRSCIETRSGPVTFTVSIGMSVYKGAAETLEDMMRRADQALYHAKNSGRDKVCCDGEF